MIPPYIHVALWYILAIYLFYTAIKENRFFFILSGFFIFLGTWALVDMCVETDLMKGGWGWIYRGVAIAVLILCAVWYYLRKKRG